MSNYNNGKVYEIVCNKTGKKYIGSTCKELLSQRLSNHKASYKSYKNKIGNFSTSFIILEGDDYYINLLEKVNASCKDELLARERHYINTIDCVNKTRPLRSKKDYYKDNIEIITAKKSVITLCECGGKYRHDNKVHHLKTNKHINYLIEKDLKDKCIFIDLSTTENILEEDKKHIHISNEIILDPALNILNICDCCGNVF